MKVATWRGEARFTIDEVPDPAPGPGQVVVDIHTAGICGTDIHATQGLFPWKPPAVLARLPRFWKRSGDISASYVGIE